MARGKTRGRTKRKATAGSFKPGPDPRRHRFSESECRLGYWVTMLGLTEKTQDPAVRAWVHQKVCIHMRQKDERRSRKLDDAASGVPDDIPF